MRACVCVCAQMAISLSVEEVGAMQRQLQEAQALKRELERVQAASAAAEVTNHCRGPSHTNSTAWVL